MNKNDERKLLRYVMLTLISGLGPVGQNLLLSVCGNIDICFELDQAEILAKNEKSIRSSVSDHNSGMDRSQRSTVAHRQLLAFLEQREKPELRSRAEEILNAIDKYGISLIIKENEAYPKRFAGIADIPVLLYVKGNLRINEYSGSVGIVGARMCSREGRERAIYLGRQVAIGHRAVISGMAKGIDAYAHTAALKENGYTIAVMGTGPEVCYPPEHRALYDTIAESGCIVSEYAPGTKPAKYLFQRRNRIIAALSDELYVIDAGRNSGTRSTVAFCERYGRRVRALPEINQSEEKR